MRKTAAAGLAVGIIAAIGFAMPASASTTGDAQLSVLHGIPDTPVDVYVNGARQIDDFQPGDLAGPLPLPAGDYEVILVADESTDASAPLIPAVTVTLAAGKNYTAVANLSATGAPTLNLFTNDTSQTAPGQGRLTVRHVAAVGPVDILAGGSPVVEDLANPDEATLNLAAGTVPAGVAPAGMPDPVLEADVQVQEGVLTIVYAWGSAEDENLALAVQTVSGLHSNPDGVPSGSAGYLAQRDATSGIITIAAGAGAIAIAIAAGTVFAMRRRQEAQR